MYICDPLYLFSSICALFCSPKYIFILGDFNVTISFIWAVISFPYSSLQILLFNFISVKIACHVCMHRSTSIFNLIIINETLKKFRASLADLITSTASLKVSLFWKYYRLFAGMNCTHYQWQEICELHVPKCKLIIQLAKLRLNITLYIFSISKIKIICCIINI